jgi:hypothetical protein
MLIGAWLAAMLYGVVVTQAYQYFRLHPMDGMYRKILVLSTVLFCTVALAADYANVYLVCLYFAGRSVFLLRYSPSQRSPFGVGCHLIYRVEN